jgi:hypothetical protein
VTDQCKKPPQRQPDKTPGHDQTESSVTINGIRILPRDDQEEFAQESIENVVLGMVGADQWSTLTDLQRREKISYYREAAIYRLIYSRPGGGKEKTFSGFRDIAFLSSGVIRNFQEIVGMAYYLQFGSTTPPGKHLRIEPAHQKKAVYLVSEHNLSALSRNVEKHGERLKYLLLDIGDCLRFKLLKHPTEPEAGRLSITDPERLRIDDHVDIRDFLTLGVREGVFQRSSGRPGMRPKHSSDPQPVEFNISRVFCPTLQFSPRFRWKTTITCQDLTDLLSADKRAKAKKRIMERLLRAGSDTRQIQLGI